MTYSQHKIFNGFKQVEIPYWAVISHLHKLVKPIYVSTQMKPLLQPKPLNTLVTLNVGLIRLILDQLPVLINCQGYVKPLRIQRVKVQYKDTSAFKALHPPSRRQYLPTTANCPFEQSIDTLTSTDSPVT